jgi:hypothetical protein
MTNASSWGILSEERRLAFPCDRYLEHPDQSLYRGITIHTSPQVVFRWLCQMRVAPYSYDWIDNGGRQSPRTLTPGLEQLAVGQDVMEIFKLVEFACNQHITIRIKPETRLQRIFGDIAVSYLVVPDKNGSCRLLVKLVAQYPRGAVGTLMRSFLPWGDLIMMRRQLLNFKELAEESNQVNGPR